LKERQRERYKRREDGGEEVSRYWITLREIESAGN
jgi:hypothetical protein